MAQHARTLLNFNKEWKFYYADTTDLNMEYNQAGFNDAHWRSLDLPHDYSIEQAFNKNAPATADGGALPGGIGWYRKTFTLSQAVAHKQTYIEFEGVYRNSEVWINDHYLGLRPNGFISFQYDITPYLKYGNEKNVIAVKVDNAKQPNSRWYSGSGIYRNVWLITTNQVAVDHWGTYITSSNISDQSATISVNTHIKNILHQPKAISLTTILLDAAGKVVGKKTSVVSDSIIHQDLIVNHPILWSIEKPYLYKAISQVTIDGKLTDEYTTTYGIRFFNFDADKGFSLNGKPTKILGVCNHHDLGSLGAAFNVHAAERQLKILKEMGCNAIRTSHNPPAPELLDLCDKMGFIVMDEAFDMWAQFKAVQFGYYLNWPQWHKKDLEDQIIRDRNHPSVMIWSIGNEVSEQTRESGGMIAKELAAIIRALDTTRPLVTANDAPDTSNKIIKYGGLDLVGYNYHHKDWSKFQQRYPGKKNIITESVSALETRGYYQMPSDSLYYWPDETKNGKKVNATMNSDHTVSAYDQVRAPWASTHEESWKELKKYDFLSGMFIWTGFDYLGEPTPYGWPSRSSYFGIIDLAGFPKDVYYMYQSEWTSKPVLHLFPHWNWNQGQLVDVWAYYNNADEVELFLNGKSLGIRKKNREDLHVMWRLPFEPGTLKAVSRLKGKTVLIREIKTAGKPVKVQLLADKKQMKADGVDLVFITAKVVDGHGNTVPQADNLIHFKINGEALLAGVDNGNPVSLEPFKANDRKLFNGLALAIIQAKQKAGKVTVTASSNGLTSSSIELEIH